MIPPGASLGGRIWDFIPGEEPDQHQNSRWLLLSFSLNKSLKQILGDASNF
jgi:hypothetical protein